MGGKPPLSPGRAVRVATASRGVYTLSDVYLERSQHTGYILRPPTTFIPSLLIVGGKKTTRFGCGSHCRQFLAIFALVDPPMRAYLPADTVYQVVVTVKQRQNPSTSLVIKVRKSMCTSLQPIFPDVCLQDKLVNVKVVHLVQVIRACASDTCMCCGRQQDV